METLVHWWECKLVQLLWKTVQRLLRKPKIELPYNLAVPLVGVYSNKTKTNLICKDTCSSVLLAALVTITKILKQPKCSSAGEWVKKMWCINVVEYCAA